MISLSRRSVMAGLAVAGLPLASSAKTAPDVASPVFPTVRGPSANVLRANVIMPSQSDTLSPYDIALYYTDRTRRAYSRCDGIIKYVVDASHGLHVRSVEEAEDRLFSSLPMKSRLHRWHPPSGYDPRLHFGGEWTSPAILLNRQANLVAAVHMFGGAGNVAFMHSETERALKNLSPTSYWQDLAETQRIGRWTKAAILNKTLMIYTAKHLPLFEVVIAHNSGIVNDVVIGPAVLLQDGRDLRLVHRVAENPFEEEHGAPITKFVFEAEGA